MKQPLQTTAISNNLIHQMSSLYFFALISLCCIASYLLLDEKIAVFIGNFTDTPFIEFAQKVTRLGISTDYIIGLSITWLLLKFAFKKDQAAKITLFLLLSIVIPGILCLILKITFGRYRPSLLQEHLYGFSFFGLNAKLWSFPSGHAMTITGLMTALSLIYRRFWPIFCLILLAVASSRVIVNAHYLSDVIFGMYLSFITVIYLYQKFWASRAEPLLPQ
jgi:membrane-associated phospholipid phosphatase